MRIFIGWACDHRSHRRFGMTSFISVLSLLQLYLNAPISIVLDLASWVKIGARGLLSRDFFRRNEMIVKRSDHRIRGLGFDQVSHPVRWLDSKPWSVGFMNSLRIIRYSMYHILKVIGSMFLLFHVWVLHIYRNLQMKRWFFMHSILSKFWFCPV